MRFPNAFIALTLTCLALSMPNQREVPAYDGVLDSLTKTICLCTTPAHRNPGKDQASAHVTYDYHNFRSNENYTITTRCEPRRKKKHHNPCWEHPETVQVKKGPTICDDGVQDLFCIDPDGDVHFSGQRRSTKHAPFTSEALPDEVSRICEVTCEEVFGFLVDRFDPGESSTRKTMWFDGIEP
ncbi:MAG: hypothetical protein Q9163_000549 [Psora crenata]